MRSLSWVGDGSWERYWSRKETNLLGQSSGGPLDQAVEEEEVEEGGLGWEGNLCLRLVP